MLYGSDRGHFRLCLGCMDRSCDHPYGNFAADKMISESISVINYIPIGLDCVLKRNGITELIKQEENEKQGIFVDRSSSVIFLENLEVFQPGVFLQHATDSRDFLDDEFPRTIFQKSPNKLKKKSDKIKTRIGFRYIVFRK